ncbi:ribonuclease Y [Clostridium acetireducens DSM 10703]|jgi:uncharacterized protein|uniref:Ribonuclease Y n=1 Tax=Clostridium acetireducens DSM 10703 TaxID=1121290 RepID=A0A1E8EY46_9CLOT|nr:HD domain-containing protein [Clostridium acetireducens]OFI05858.1 ribonuclease Y [Clostridium acetireducens DSM 10703]
MERFNSILKHEKFKEYLNKINNLEVDRILCHHDIQHFIDVARIMYIIALENNFPFNKDIIYASALLHDIGRWQQYEEDIPHEIASFNLAKDILKDCHYNEEEIEEILIAIKNHRNKYNEKGSLSELIYKSDKLSRMCFNCLGQEECNWSEYKKNNENKFKY